MDKKNNIDPYNVFLGLIKAWHNDFEDIHADHFGNYLTHTVRFNGSFSKKSEDQLGLFVAELIIGKKEHTGAVMAISLKGSTLFVTLLNNRQKKLKIPLSSLRSISIGVPAKCFKVVTIASLKNKLQKVKVAV